MTRDLKSPPRRNNRLGYRNLHMDENDRFCCDIRVTRDGLVVHRRLARFDSLEEALAWRDEQRELLGLRPAR